MLEVIGKFCEALSATFYTLKVTSAIRRTLPCLATHTFLFTLCMCLRLPSSENIEILMFAL